MNCCRTHSGSGRMQEAEETRDLSGFSNHNERKGFAMSGRKSIRERFESKYKVDESTGCWLWTAGKFRNGYGQFRDGRNFHSHRVSYELHVGPIPEGICVLHKCDTPGCVNPKHLFLGTVDDNNKDKASKGRAARLKGSRNPRSKLTEDEVSVIRSFMLSHPTHGNRWSPNSGGLQFLADWFGVKRCAIVDIMRKSKGRRWKHVV